MPPISNRETIPNFPLNGQELAIYAVKVFETECELRDLLCLVREPAVRAMKQALENDWVFNPQFVYGGASFTIALQTHVTRNHEVKTAFTLDLVFRFPNIATMPEHKPFVRRPVICSAPPLEGFSTDAEHVVDCFTIAVKVENPNLVRVHCQLPITISEKVQPKHGEMFGKIKNHELTYDPADYESLPEPVVTEQSAKFAKAWGLEGIALLHVIADSTHQPIDEQELVAHVDLTEAEIALERATTNRRGETGHFPDSAPSDATTDAKTPKMPLLGRSMVREIAESEFVRESDRVASSLAEINPSTASESTENANARATTNQNGESATLLTPEESAGVDTSQVARNGTTEKVHVSKRDRKRFK